MVIVSIWSFGVDLNLTYALCIKKHRNARSRSTILLLRKDLQEKHLRCIKESRCVDSSSDVAADSKLLSFVNNPRHAYKPQTNEAASLTEVSLSVESSNDDSSERYAQNVLFSSDFQYFLTLFKCQCSSWLVHWTYVHHKIRWWRLPHFVWHYVSFCWKVYHKLEKMYYSYMQARDISI